MNDIFFQIYILIMIVLFLVYRKQIIIKIEHVPFVSVGVIHETV